MDRGVEEPPPGLPLEEEIEPALCSSSGRGGREGGGSRSGSIVGYPPQEREQEEEGAEAVPQGEDGSAGFGFGSTGGDSSSSSSRRPTPRRLLSRRRSSFSVVPPEVAAASVSLDASQQQPQPPPPPQQQQQQQTTSTAVIVASSRLGAGASGVAFSVNNSVDGRTYVLKRIPIPLKGGGLEALYNEPRLHARLKHGNIISYQYSWVERATAKAAGDGEGGAEEEGVSALCILLERADAELWQVLVKPDDAEEARPSPPPAGVALGLQARLRMAYELASALAAVHAAGVVHRDISPWNIFIANGSAKLGDFGLAASLPLDQPGRYLSGLHSPGCMPLDGSALASIYSAPELGSAAYGHAVDVYSLGLCLLSLLLRPLPAHPGAHSDTPPTPTTVPQQQLLDANALVDAIQRARAHPATGVTPDVLLPGTPPGLAPLLCRMLAPDPASRPPAQVVKEEMRVLVLTAGGLAAGPGLGLGLLPRDDSLGMLRAREESESLVAGAAAGAATAAEEKGAPPSAPGSTRGGRPPLPSGAQAQANVYAHRRPPSASAVQALPPAALSLSLRPVDGPTPTLLLPESGSDCAAGEKGTKRGHREAQQQQQRRRRAPRAGCQVM